MSGRSVRKAVIALSAGILAIVPATAKKAPVEHVYGPPPTWEKYREIAEAYLKNRAIDPESAQITWLGKYFKGEHKPFLRPRSAGYVACGTINAKNRMGGYAGAAPFIVVIDNDQVLFGDLEQLANGMVGSMCQIYAKQLKFEPLSGAERSPSDARAESSAAASDKLTIAATGLSLQAMPDGAYIGGVAAGTPAALAGLTPGMVITAVNAIPLRGMGNAMLKVIDAAGADATVSIIGGKTITLGTPK